MQNIIFSQGYSYIENIKKSFQLSGAKGLHILADFDNTLTKKFVDGQERPSLIGILRQEKILGEAYSKEAFTLYDIYSPIEKDPHIPLTQKKEKMSEWWSKHLELLLSSGITKEHISQALTHSGLRFREGFSEFAHILSQHTIPLVIISANGIGGESIRQFFEQQQLLTDNISIISNEFEWDENGKARGYKNEVVHSFNKDETVLHNFPEVYESIKERKNVMLLGDSLGDPGMIEGFDAENLIKIGFLNTDREKLEKHYREVYDVVIVEDGSFEFPLQLLQKII